MPRLRTSKEVSRSTSSDSSGSDIKRSGSSFTGSSGRVYLHRGQLGVPASQQDLDALDITIEESKSLVNEPITIARALQDKNVHHWHRSKVVRALTKVRAVQRFKAAGLKRSSTVVGVGGAILSNGDEVWIRDDQGSEAFKRGVLSRVGKEGATVLHSGCAVVKRPDELYAANRADDVPPDDHSALVHLNEPSILDNARQRYMRGSIYTYTGHILVALNPFEPLPIYAADTVAQYAQARRYQPTDPHVYSLAERAYSHMLRLGTNQTIIMSGESGAGKTETAKYTMLYLATRASSRATPNGRLEAISEAIMQSNPVTEAFGNARTKRNNNSSRFGKYICIYFSGTGAVAAADIHTYLLERTRVTQLSEGERSYHVFYQLLAGSSEAFRVANRLVAPDGTPLGPADFGLLRQSSCSSIDGVSDTLAFEQLRASLDLAGVAQAQYEELFSIVAGLLHLGSVGFVKADAEDENCGSRPDPSSASSLAAACDLLGLPHLSERLTSRQISAGGSIIVHQGESKPISKPLQPEEATRARDSMVRVVYSHAFDWLLSQLNSLLTQPKVGVTTHPTEPAPAGGGSTASRVKPTSDGPLPTTYGNKLRHIGLLDIFGFESFATNSFEQLCINFANEKLQQFFLHCTFRAEKEVHLAEGVNFPAIEFADNQGCIDSMEKNPHGVLRLLDLQCKLPAPSSAAFFDAVNTHHRASSFFKPVSKARKLPNEAFIVRHYAGDVCYEAKGGSWLEKNNDTLPADLENDVSTSTVAILRQLFATRGEGAAVPGRSGQRSNRFNSVGRRFINDLNRLHEALASTDAHFIRCIKPNSALKAKAFEPQLVLAQLRSNGVFDAVELMKAAYPTRLRYEAIHGQYAHLLPKDLVGKLPPAGFCEVVALACQVARSDYALGLTQLFLRAGKGAFLEELVAMDVKEVVPLLEQKIREHERRRIASRLVANKVLAYYMRHCHLRKRRLAAMLQRLWRGARARAAVAKLRKERGLEKLKCAQRHVAALKPAAHVPVGAPVEPRQAPPPNGSEVVESKALELARAELVAMKTRLQAAEQAANDLRCELELERSGARTSALLSNEGSLQTEPSLALARAEAGAPRSHLEAEDSSCDRLTVSVTRDEETGTLGVDIDMWDGRVTVASVEPSVPAFGVLQVGDIIECVGGLPCGDDMAQVLKRIIESADIITMQVCRPPVIALLRHEMQMCEADGEWQYVMCTITSNRLLTWDTPLEGGNDAQPGEIVTRSAKPGEIALNQVVKLEMYDAVEETPATLIISLIAGEYRLRYLPSDGEGGAGGTAVLRAWHEQMKDMLMPSTTESHDSMIERAMVFQQGYLDVAVGLNEWKTCYLVLNGTDGLQVYEDAAACRRGDPIRTISVQLIRKATRSTGLEFFEWGVQIHTFADDEVLDVRAPSHAEMNRWLSTLNMHTTLLLRDRRHSSLSNIAAGTNTSASAALAWSRRSSASIAELAPPKVPMRQVELIAGWLSVRKESTLAIGSKRRFCRLMGMVALSTRPRASSVSSASLGSLVRRSAYAGDTRVENVRLCVLRTDGEPLHEGRAIPLARLSRISLLSMRANKRVTIAIQLGQRQMRLTASDMAWLLELRLHWAQQQEQRPALLTHAHSSVWAAPSPFLLMPPPNGADTKAKIDAPIRAAWMEVAVQRGGEEEWFGEFALAYVVLTARRTLEYYADEASVGVDEPRGRIVLHSGAPARLLDDPPYNYEHALWIGEKAPDANAAPSGLKWVPLSAEVQLEGTEIVHEALAKTLVEKTELTPSEWAAFGIQGLRFDHYVRSGDREDLESLFVPAVRQSVPGTWLCPDTPNETQAWLDLLNV